MDARSKNFRQRNTKDHLRPWETMVRFFGKLIHLTVEPCNLRNLEVVEGKHWAQTRFMPQKLKKQEDISFTLDGSQGWVHAHLITGGPPSLFAKTRCGYFLACPIFNKRLQGIHRNNKMVYSKEQNKSPEPFWKKQRLWTLNIFKASVLNVLKLKENPKN